MPKTVPPYSCRALADAAKRPDAAVFPDADDQLGALGLRARDRLAAGAHDREQRLDAVDAVPEQVGVMLLERAGAIGVAAERCRPPWG